MSNLEWPNWNENLKKNLKIQDINYRDIPNKVCIFVVPVVLYTI